MMRKNTLDLSYYSKNPLLFRKLKKRKKKHYRRPDASTKLQLFVIVTSKIQQIPAYQPLFKTTFSKGEGKYRDVIRKQKDCHTRKPEVTQSYQHPIQVGEEQEETKETSEKNEVV